MFLKNEKGMDKLEKFSSRLFNCRRYESCKNKNNE